jgi:anti-sigma-K factor RskA
MIDERTEELASLYALDLLDGTDRQAFERRLDSEPALARLVGELRSAGQLYGLAAPSAQPSPGLRDRILASAASRPTSAPVPVDAAQRNKVVPFSAPVWLGWAAAAAFALVAGWLAQQRIAGQRALADARTEVAVERVEAQSLQQQLEAERLLAGRTLGEAQRLQVDLAGVREALAAERLGAARQLAELQGRYDLANFKVSRLASLLGNSPEATAIAVWNPSTQEGVLTVEKLPALMANQDYQLWVIDPQYPNPVDGGVFTVDSTTGVGRLQFRPRQPVAQAAKFAISRERKGGVPKAEGPIVLVGP